MSIWDIDDHPEIKSYLRTGYSTFEQPEKIYCEECGKEIGDYEIPYEDATHTYLCRECLLTLHEKW